MITKQQADESLAKIHRADLIDEDPNFIIVDLVTEIMNLKQVLRIRKEMNEELQEENADLRRQLLFDEE